MKYLITLMLLITSFTTFSKEDKKMIKLVFTLKITDEIKYKEYRQMIKPLMSDLGIKVIKEYRIDQVVHSNEATEKVNLLAMFGFPSQEVKSQFFTSKVYQDAKKLFLISTENFQKLVE